MEIGNGFNRIVCVDNTKLQDWAIEDLQRYSKDEVKCYKNPPSSTNELLERIGDAEAVLVSWKTSISKEVISSCPRLKYIGMACSLYDDASANVAVNFAREKGITVTGIFDYGDPGVVEFIISELVRLLHGLGPHQWKQIPVELSGRRIGIIGMGTTGSMLAECLLPFGAELCYFSRTRKEEWEARGVKYRSLYRLLQECEILSFHLPRNTKVLDQEGFAHLGNGKILINTSLGAPFDKEAFWRWIGDQSNFAIFDADGKKELRKPAKDYQNIIAADKSAGWSAETARRLSEKVVGNLREYLHSDDRL